jgi:hypothetical protein
MTATAWPHADNWVMQVLFHTCTFLQFGYIHLMAPSNSRKQRLGAEQTITSFKFNTYRTSNRIITDLNISSIFMESSDFLAFRLQNWRRTSSPAEGCQPVPKMKVTSLETALLPQLSAHAHAGPRVKWSALAKCVDRYTFSGPRVVTWHRLINAFLQDFLAWRKHARFASGDWWCMSIWWPGVT